MDSSEKDKLMEEYVKRFRKVIYWVLKLTGFCRFDIRNGKIVQLTTKSLLYNTSILIVADCSVAYLLYSSIYIGNYLKLPDGLCVIHFAMFANVILINLSFLNRRSGLELIESCINIDCYLGVKETAFMRDVAIRTFLALHIMVILFNILRGIFMYNMYYNVSMSIHFTGALYFFWLFFSYDDYCFSFMHYVFIALRVRYLNVALLKIGNMNEEYLPGQSIFNILFWHKKFNKIIKFQNRAGYEDFNRVFRMTFGLLRLLERFYGFPFLCGVWTIVMGSFVAVQTLIMRIKYESAVENEHTYVIGGWVLLSWGFMLLGAVLTDMFEQQIGQTKLICTYLQLKPNNSADIYKLTKTVLHTIEIRNARPSVYALFLFDTGFILKIAASTLVYITVQLQLAFPKLPLSSVKLNETISTPTPHFS